MMISNLPDELLVHILSFLPTQFATRTSILSSRWKNLWTKVFNLDIRPIKTYWTCEERSKYIDFTERVIMSRESKINKLYLDCSSELANYHNPNFKDWISNVVDRFVQDISIVGFDSYTHLPKSLFTCKTLVSLKLVARDYCGGLDVPDSIHFPCLTVLHVNLLCPSSVLTQKLFCSSPQLEDLCIHADYTDRHDSEVYIYNIWSPFLKKLVLKIFKKDYHFSCVVNVDAPVLESLELQLVPSVDFRLKNSPALIRARLVYFETGSPFVEEIKLLESVSSVKELSLGGHLSIPVFGFSSREKWPAFPFVTHLTSDIHHVQLDLTRAPTWNIFPDLMHLQLNFYGSCSFMYFLKILSWVPNLSTLVINKKQKDYEFLYFEQAEVPRCLGSHVREIKLLKFNGSSNDLQLVKYLLENAGALEKLTVSMSDNVERKGDWSNKIVTLPRSSKEVQFVIDLK